MTFRLRLVVWAAALWLTAPLACASLGLNSVIPLPGVRGQFGHLAVDATHQRLYVCVTGENRLLVIDLASDAVTGRLSGLDRPRGLVYLPEKNRVALSNTGSGELDFFAADSLAPSGAISFGTDADGLVYDAASRRIYLGYGKGTASGIAIVSPEAQPLGQLALHTHPAGFVVNHETRRLYVNLPAIHTIAVFDLTSNRRVATWSLGSGSGANGAMALDAAANRLFVATRHPDRMRVLEAQSGRQLQVVSAPADVNQLTYNPVAHELYAVSGAGQLVVYAVAVDGELHKADELPTTRGASTAALDVADRHYYVAVPAHNRQVAEIRVYIVTASESGSAS